MHRVLLLLLLLAGLAVGALALAKMSTVPDVPKWVLCEEEAHQIEVYNPDPTYYTGKLKVLVNADTCKINKVEYTYSYTPPKPLSQDEPGKALLLLRVYIDGEKVFNDYVGHGWVEIPVPGKYAGKTVQVEAELWGWG